MEVKALREDLNDARQPTTDVATLRAGGRKKTFGLHGSQGIARISDARHTAADVADSEQG